MLSALTANIKYREHKGHWEVIDMFGTLTVAMESHLCADVQTLQNI